MGLMRWYVQAEARFAHAHELRVEEAVERHLMEAAAIRPGTESVQGDPGPRIWTGITVDADDADSAISVAGTVLADALEAAGAGAGAYVLEVGRAVPLRGKWWSPNDRSLG
jgi:hypothetical protein